MKKGKSRRPLKTRPRRASFNPGYNFLGAGNNPTAGNYMGGEKGRQSPAGGATTKRRGY